MFARLTDLTAASASLLVANNRANKMKPRLKLVSGHVHVFLRTSDPVAGSTDLLAALKPLTLYPHEGDKYRRTCVLSFDTYLLAATATLVIHCSSIAIQSTFCFDEAFVPKIRPLTACVLASHHAHGNIKIARLSRQDASSVHGTNC